MDKGKMEQINQVAPAFMSIWQREKASNEKRHSHRLHRFKN